MLYHKKLSDTTVLKYSLTNCLYFDIYNINKLINKCALIHFFIMNMKTQTPGGGDGEEA